MSIITVQQFASLLDGNHFDEAAQLLVNDCHYRYYKSDYQGAKNIANIYRQNHLQSLKIFDELVYSSSVEVLSEDTYKINCTDKIRKAILWHDLHWYQIVKVKDDLIVDIESCDIPGEQETLRAFYNKAMSMARMQ